MPNQQLAKEIYKPIIRKFEKLKVHSFFIDSIWGADLADMQLIKDFYFCLVFIFIVNMHGLFLSKIKEVLQLLASLFKKN